MRNGTACRRKELKIQNIDPPHFSIKIVDIFAMGMCGLITPCCSYCSCVPDPPCSQVTFKELTDQSDFSFAGTSHHDYESMVEWDPTRLFEDCLEWLRTIDTDVETYSRSWLFSSFRTQQLLSSLISKKLCEALRVLVETTTLIHNWGPDAPFPNFSSREVHGIRSFAGTSVIRALDVSLRPSNLASNSANELAGLLSLYSGLSLQSAT